MKKGRPGMLLSVIVERSKIERILGVLFRETTTIGVRIQHVERKKLPRTSKQIKTSFGMISTKVIMVEGKEQVRVEFEECKRIASEKNIPLAEVYRIIEFELKG
jgi:uncharacterized protein (DUF111 family)